MKDQDTTRTLRRRLRHTTLALAAVAAVAVGHGAARAETEEGPGAGTQFRNCTDHAWADYNSCLMDAGGAWSRKFCDLAFEADIVWCGAVFKRQITTGVN